MYIGPWQELELARLLARHRFLHRANGRQQTHNRLEEEQHASTEGSRTVLPLLNSTLVGGPRSTGALNSNRRRVSNDLSIRYDRLLGCPAEKPRSVTPSPSIHSPTEHSSLPKLVSKTRLHRNIKSRPQLPTTEKRRIHLEHFRRVYWQTRDERETATTSRCSEAPSSPCPVIKRDEADEFNDPLIAWSNGLDIDKLLESPRLSTMAQFG